MGELQDFVAELLERQGAAVEKLDAGGLEVLVPQRLQETLGFAELVQLSFGANRPGHAIPIGLEGDWLDRFGALLGEHGRWAERQLTLTGAPEAPGNPERVGQIVAMSTAAREENLVGAELDLCTDRCFARRSHRRVTVGAESHRVGWRGAANLGLRRVLPFGRCSGCSCILARSHHLTCST